MPSFVNNISRSACGMRRLHSLIQVNVCRALRLGQYQQLASATASMLRRLACAILISSYSIGLSYRRCLRIAWCSACHSSANSLLLPATMFTHFRAEINRIIKSHDIAECGSNAVWRIGSATVLSLTFILRDGLF